VGERRVRLVWRRTGGWATRSAQAQPLLPRRYGVETRPGGVRMLNPLFGKENLQRAAPLLDTQRQVADALDAKPAQVALA